MNSIVRSFFLAVAMLGASASFAAAGCVGGFQPIAPSLVPGSNGEFTTVQFYAENGNQEEINGSFYTIPSGVPVESGGVQGVYNNAYIDKVAGQTLVHDTTYFVYVWMNAGTMTLDFSTNGHTPDPTTGIEVMDNGGTIDATQTLVGMVHMNGNGYFYGDAGDQLTIGWCPAGRATVALEQGLNYPLGTSSTTWVVPSGSPTISWLQWGVDSQFGEGFNNPNIEAFGDVGSSTGNSDACEVNVQLDGNPNLRGIAGSAAIMFTNQAMYMRGYMASAGGTNEGYHYAQIIMEAPNGGNCHWGVGALVAFPVQS